MQIMTHKDKILTHYKGGELLAFTIFGYNVLLFYKKGGFYIMEKEVLDNFQKQISRIKEDIIYSAKGHFEDAKWWRHWTYDMLYCFCLCVCSFCIC